MRALKTIIVDQQLEYCLFRVWQSRRVGGDGNKCDPRSDHVIKWLIFAGLKVCLTRLHSTTQRYPGNGILLPNSSYCSDLFSTMVSTLKKLLVFLTPSRLLSPSQSRTVLVRVQKRSIACTTLQLLSMIDVLCPPTIACIDQFVHRILCHTDILTESCT